MIKNGSLAYDHMSFKILCISGESGFSNDTTTQCVVHPSASFDFNRYDAHSAEPHQETTEEGSIEIKQIFVHLCVSQDLDLNTNESFFW